MRCDCDSDTDSNRATPTARETSKTQTLRNTGPFFPPLLLVGSKELVLKVPKQGQFHAAKKTLRFVCPSCTRDTDGIAAKLFGGIASEALRRNMPLRLRRRRLTRLISEFLALRVDCKKARRDSLTWASGPHPKTNLAAQQRIMCFFLGRQCNK